MSQEEAGKEMSQMIKRAGTARLGRRMREELRGHGRALTSDLDHVERTLQ